MPLVRFKYVRPDGTATDRPLAGRVLDLSLVRREEVGGAVRVTESFSTVLDVDGVVTAELSPTLPGQAWQVSERWTHGRPKVAYVVPDTAETVDATDLVEVDPATLEPSAQPEAAWTIEVGALAARIEEVATVVGDPEAVNKAINAALTEHINSEAPHPTYDDVASYVLSINNALI